MGLYTVRPEFLARRKLNICWFMIFLGSWTLFHFETTPVTISFGIATLVYLERDALNHLLMLILGSVSKTARSRSTCKTKSSIHFICTLSNIYLPSSFRNWIFSQHYPLQGVKAGFSLNIYLLINKSPDKCFTSFSTRTLPCLMPDVVNRTQSNCSHSNDFDWVR